MIDSKKGGGHPPLDAQTADGLLERLSADDEFRATFEKDPAAALEQIGVADTGDALAGASCLRVTNLATKEEIQASRAALQDYLTSAGTHVIVFCFEDGEIAQRLSRK